MRGVAPDLRASGQLRRRKELHDGFRLISQFENVCRGGQELLALLPSLDGDVRLDKHAQRFEPD